MARTSFGWEVLEALAVVTAFAGFGLGWAALEEGALRPQRPYPSRPVETPIDPPSIWLVDGFNALHAGVLKGRDRSDWWTRERREQLLALARRFDVPGAEIWVVFDGPRPAAEEPGAGSGRVRQVFAPSADEWLAARVRTSEDPSRIAVVTADRRLSGRARQRGARIVSPRAFLERCRGEVG